LKATIIIPTHNHSNTLKYTLKSALEQTIQDVEIFVIGDGVQDDTRHLMKEFSKRDKRVRFFDHLKGPRHGEIYRHQALNEAKGDIVAYLSDDDLWLPNHLENLSEILQEGNVGNVLPIIVDQNNQMDILNVDLSIPFYKNLHLSGLSRIPLSTMGHTLKLYRELPFGWRTTPFPVSTDLYMLQQFLSHPKCCPRSSLFPSVFCFPSRLRTNVSDEKRGEESKMWFENIKDPLWLENAYKQLLIKSIHGWNKNEVVFEKKCSSGEWRLGNRLFKIPGIKFTIKCLAKALRCRPVV